MAAGSAGGTPSISVVVPATDSPPTLARCLEALERSSDSPDELIVVAEPAGAGPAAARNAGAARAGGELLLFVDSDVVVRHDALARVRAAFADPTLTAVFGSYDDSPDAPGPVSGFRNLLHHHVHQEAAGPASTFWAGLGAIRRQAFLAAGGFDAERFGVPSVEDIDLGARLAAAGARIELDPELQGTHLKAWTVGGMVSTDFARRGVPWVLLVLERGAPSDALNLGWRNRFGAAAALLGLGGVLARRPRAVAAGAGALLVLNAQFYALLARRRGPAEAGAGMGLHALHLLVAAAAVPAGVLVYAMRRLSAS